MRRHQHSTPKTHNCNGFQGLRAPYPALAALILLADFEANDLKTLDFLTDD
jgi:hypothetical protein